ncbi:MAG: hypothetical protein A3C07_01445 [Candidatus Sungbacteria bacterium RIFCSPHIGHO2_02_FULL_47_11]|uniref:Uncharacterized protein n=1 Tax=Candidatus Sungbacteria bacterium RIFCSPHIGHO2_02_FULL_47_11 TaxID=1802270 RepID=A0A1G2KPY1_9BACT|nr:MAG: hypothetical protein A3C07_01445 [Candidatus Sungbacteria bacterium RIFCSPHIGHO2_02_FULL_47_11]
MYLRASVIIILAIPLLAGAQVPSVVSFGASPTSVSSGFPVGFSWDIENAGGYSFIIPCVSGIKMFNQSGTVLNCGSKISSTTKTDDFMTVVIHNVSGGAKSVTARIIPKDAGGNDNDGASRDVSVSVATLAEPIMSFTTSATTTSPGQAITVSWTSQIISGVNLSLECKSGINVSSQSYTPGGFIPCGTLIFSQDLSPSSSLSLSFLNPSASAVPYRITLLPAIENGSYDGAHAKYLDLKISSDIIPDSSVISFTTPTKTIPSGGSATFSWTTTNAIGVNLQVACSAFIQASSSGATANLPCGELAFANPLGVNSSLTLAFTNTGTLSRDVLIKLLPSKKSGEYDATRAKDIVITVTPPLVPKETAVEVPQATSTAPFPVLPTPTQFVIPPPPQVTPPPLPKATEGTVKPPTPPIVKPPLSPPPETPQTKESETPSVHPTTEYKTMPFLKSTPRMDTVDDRLKDILTKKEVVSYTTSISATKESGGEGVGQVYEVVGRKRVSLFALIPIYMEVRVVITAFGEIQEIKKPWWSFLTR